MLPTIQLKTALAEIDQAGALGVPFSLDYVKQDGTLGRKDRLVKAGQATATASHAASSASTTSTSAEPAPGLNYSVKHAGLLLVRDLSTGRHCSLKIRRLTHYNNIKIIHG
jgi:hypothetical protein